MHRDATVTDYPGNRAQHGQAMVAVALHLTTWN